MAGLIQHDLRKQQKLRPSYPALLQTRGNQKRRKRPSRVRGSVARPGLRTQSPTAGRSQGGRGWLSWPSPTISDLQVA